MSDQYRTNSGPPRIIPKRSWRWLVYAIAFILGGGLFSSTGKLIYTWIKTPKPCATTVTYHTTTGCSNTYKCHPDSAMEILSNDAIICKCK